MANNKHDADKWARDPGNQNLGNDRRVAQSLVRARHAVKAHKGAQRNAIIGAVVAVALLLFAITAGGVMALILVVIAAVVAIKTQVWAPWTATFKQSNQVAQQRLIGVRQAALRFPGHSQHMSEMEAWWKRRYNRIISHGYKAPGALRPVILDPNANDGRSQYQRDYDNYEYQDDIFWKTSWRSGAGWTARTGTN